jgi:membrane associated rhomboid family serine protease
MKSNKKAFEFSWDMVLYPLLFVLLIWGVYWFELSFNYNFNKFGIYPLTWHGLVGIVSGPFIHGSLEHLYHNSIPLFLLSMALFYFYRPIAWKVLLYGSLIAGLFTWLIARPSYHIGASGVIYLLSFFLFFKGIFSRHYRLIAVSLIIVFIYGSLVWGLFPQEKNTSWEGHSAGALAGLLMSIIYFKFVPVAAIDIQKKYTYSENDPFLQQFDEHGNFIPPEKLIEMEKKNETTSLSEEVEINYQYKLKGKASDDTGH